MSKAAPKKAAVKKAPVKRAPRKKAVAVFPDDLAPVKEKLVLPDFFKSLRLPPLVKYGGMVAGLVLLFLWAKNGCNARYIDKNMKKVETLKTKEQGQEDNARVLLDSMKAIQEETIRIIDEANKATDERKETEKQGEQIRNETQKKTNETIKKINAPNADRDAILDDLLQSRKQVRISQYDSMLIAIAEGTQALIDAQTYWQAMTS